MSLLLKASLSLAPFVLWSWITSCGGGQSSKNQPSCLEEKKSKVIKKKTCTILKVSLKETMKNLHYAMSLSFLHFSLFSGFLSSMGQFESENSWEMLWSRKHWTHARNYQMPDTHGVQSQSLLPLESSYSHPFFSVRMRKQFSLEMVSTPTKRCLLIPPFIFSRDNQLPEMCHFKQASPSHLAET